MTPADNKQLQRTVIPLRVRAASASFHYAHAARWIAQRAALNYAVSRHPMRTRLHQSIPLVLATFLFAIAAPALSQEHELELQIQCLRSDDAVALRVTLRNVGSTDTAVVLGTSIGNGQRYVADSLVLDFKRREGDDAEGFRPTLGAIAGRIDPWIVTVPAASEFSFERPENYLFSSHGEPLRIGNGGFIRLRLIQSQFAGELVGAALVKVSTDQLQTEWVGVPGECHVG